jgi:hypothetical protein
MNEQIKRGRAHLLLLLSAICLIFLVNIFYPLYLSPPEPSHRYTMFFSMLVFGGLACKGVRGMRAAISALLFILALLNSLVFFAALTGGRAALSLAVGFLIFVHLLLGWLLLASASIRAFEAAQQRQTAKI